MRGRGLIRSLILSKYFLLFIFTLGALAFLLPLVTSAINHRSQTRVISNYDREMKALSQAEKAKLKDDARRYNKYVGSLEGRATDELTLVEEQSCPVVYMDALSTGPAIGTLEIPSIDVDLPIYRTANEDALRHGVGHLARSSLPVGGPSTHSVLVGHRGLPSARLFRDLDSLEPGAIFFVKTLDTPLAYQVESKTRVLPSEVDALQVQEGRDLCTLITCDPYMINSHRLLVTGFRVAYNADTRRAAQHPHISFFKKYSEYVIIGGSFAALGFFAGAVRRRLRRGRRRGKADGDVAP